MARKAVLLKVSVQTVWAEVDDESNCAIEHITSPLMVPGPEWAAFYERWSQDWASIQAQVAAADVDREKALTNGAAAASQ